MDTPRVGRSKQVRYKGQMYPIQIVRGYIKFRMVCGTHKDGNPVEGCSTCKMQAENEAGPVGFIQDENGLLYMAAIEAKEDGFNVAGAGWDAKTAIRNLRKECKRVV